ncbi:YdcF family protein [Ramlibacter sp.]|uniref:YdcF family protein n=1 Tax=Ramlibacter sp. TaxID=1917967 RepID=UPI003D09D49E
MLMLAALVGRLSPARGSRRLANGLALFAFAWLWVWSTPLASESLARWLEADAGARTMAELPRARAAVVLGGGMLGARPPLLPYPDMGAAADRMWHAARIYHAGKAPLLVLSGGISRPGEPNESEAMQLLLLDLGVPREAMRLEGASFNTASNARMSARLLEAEGIRSVLLVTSALHMRRARKNFEAAGIHVVPAPTDFGAVARPFDVGQLLPEASALTGSADAMKELVGYAVGR